MLEKILKRLLPVFFAIAFCFGLLMILELITIPEGNGWHRACPEAGWVICIFSGLYLGICLNSFYNRK